MIRCCRDKQGNQIWLNSHDKLHRENGPAFIGGHQANLFWYIDGSLHRENGPAIEYVDGRKDWYLNGLRHREDGPAIEYPNGGKEWWVNGQLHRENGPAVECLDHLDNEYYLHGQTGSRIKQKVKDNIARIQAQKDQQDLLNILCQDNSISAKINTSSSAKTLKKL